MREGGDCTDSDSDVDDYFEGNRFELMGAVALKLAFDHLSAYIPRVLVTTLVEEAVASEEDGASPLPALRPRISNYFGPLMLIDISGMTRLSGVLSLALLQSTISAVFTTVIDIVLAHGGDVVKFAGDAVYVLWPASSPAAAAELLQAAFACGQRVVCAPLDMNITVRGYLTCGNVKALQVGHRGRFEYLLAGESASALSRIVSEAESVPGSLTLDGQAHAIMHALDSQQQHQHQQESCSCCRIDPPDSHTHGSLYRLEKKDTETAAAGAGLSPTKTRELMARTRRLYSSLRDDNKKAFLQSLTHFEHEATRGDRITRSSSRFGQSGMEIRECVVIFCRFPHIETSLLRASSEDTLSTLQLLFEIVVDALALGGGQLRQFIMDDKGLVGIGTVGLPNSIFPATLDADSGGLADMGHRAVTIARCILAKLRETDVGVGETPVTASIGISKGSNFVGPIGHQMRREYGVMGAMTNLAARLMVRAEENQILCNEDLALFEFRHKFTKSVVTSFKGFNRVSVYALCGEQELTGPTPLPTLRSHRHIAEVSVFFRRVAAIPNQAASSASAPGDDEEDCFNFYDVEEEEEVVVAAVDSQSKEAQGELDMTSFLRSSFLVLGVFVGNHSPGAGGSMDHSLSNKSDVVSTLESTFADRSPNLRICTVMATCTSTSPYEPFSILRCLMLEMVVSHFLHDGASSHGKGKAKDAGKRKHLAAYIGALLLKGSSPADAGDDESVSIADLLAWWLSQRAVSRSARAGAGSGVSKNLFAALVRECREKAVTAKQITEEITRLFFLLIDALGSSDSGAAPAVVVLEVRNGELLDMSTSDVLVSALELKSGGVLVHVQDCSTKSAETHFSHFSRRHPQQVCTYERKLHVDRKLAEAVFARALGCVVPLSDSQLQHLSALTGGSPEAVDQIVEYVVIVESRLLTGAKIEAESGTTTTNTPPLVADESSNLESIESIESIESKEARLSEILDRVLSVSDAFTYKFDQLPQAMRNVLKFCALAGEASPNFSVAEVLNVMWTASEEYLAEQREWANASRTRGDRSPSTADEERLRIIDVTFQDLLKSGFVRVAESQADRSTHFLSAVLTSLGSDLEGSDVSSADSIPTHAQQLTFASQMQQERLYSLMLDDQRGAYHDLFGRCLSLPGNDAIEDFETWKTAAAHFELAGNWLYSLCCFYISYTRLMERAVSPDEESLKLLLRAFAIFRRAAEAAGIEFPEVEGGGAKIAVGKTKEAVDRKVLTAKASNENILEIPALASAMAEAEVNIFRFQPAAGNGGEGVGVGPTSRALAVAANVYDLFGGDFQACELTLSMLTRCALDQASILHLFRSTSPAERIEGYALSNALLSTSVYLALHSHKSLFQGHHADEFPHVPRLPAFYKTQIPNLSADPPTSFGSDNTLALFSSLALIQSNVFNASFLPGANPSTSRGGQDFFLIAAEANLRAQGEQDVDAIVHVCRALYVDEMIALQGLRLDTALAHGARLTSLLLKGDGAELLQPRIAERCIAIYGLNRCLLGAVVNSYIRALCGDPIPPQGMTQLERLIAAVHHPGGSTQAACAMAMCVSLLFSPREAVGPGTYESCARVLDRSDFSKSYVLSSKPLLLLWAKLTVACSRSRAVVMGLDETLDTCPSVPDQSDDEVASEVVSALREFRRRAALAGDSQSSTVLLELTGSPPPVLMSEALLCAALISRPSAPAMAAVFARESISVARAFIGGVGGVPALEVFGCRVVCVVRSVWVLAEALVLAASLETSEARPPEPAELAEVLSFAERHGLNGVAARTRFVASVLWGKPT